MDILFRPSGLQILLKHDVSSRKLAAAFLIVNSDDYNLSYSRMLKKYSSEYSAGKCRGVGT